MNYTKEQRRAKFETLTEALKDAMVSEQTADAIGHIAEKYALTDEQTPKLAQEVGTVLLGFIPKEKLAEQLVAEVALSPEQAQKIAGEIEKEIFAEVPSASRPYLKGEYPKRSEGEGVSVAEKTPLRLADSAPPLWKRAGGENEIPPTPPPAASAVEPRSVPIRKPAPTPPRRSVGQAPQLPTIQSLLADIKRGTAYDERRIEEAFRKTPIEVRQTLESVGFLSRLENIAKKFGLNVEETGELVSESGLVMLGLTLPVQFVDNLAKRLRLPRDRAMAVGQSVNMEVLRPVREILRKMGQPTQNTPPRLADSAPLLNQGGDERKERAELRFAPSVPVPSPSRPLIKGGVPEQSEGEGVSATEKTPLRPDLSSGHLPFQKGQEETKSGYTTDPYREPIE